MILMFNVDIVEVLSLAQLSDSTGQQICFGYWVSGHPTIDHRLIELSFQFPMVLKHSVCFDWKVKQGGCCYWKVKLGGCCYGKWIWI